MARLSTVNNPAPDPTAINLTRMIARLQKILISPDQDTESKLRSSSLEREKVGTNLEHARSLLLKLEQDAQNIKVQTRKQETQMELSKKREMIQRLSERLEELHELGANEDQDDDSSEGEDLLGEDTPSEETDSHSHASHIDPQSDTPSPLQATSPALAPTEPSLLQPEIPPTPDFPPSQISPESQSALRSRAPRSERAELLSTTTGSSIPHTSEALLTHNRTEQESLTASLLSMASQLKTSSQSFSASLESEKTILDSATTGLDKNERGMEAAQKRVGALRRLTEGRGWWGRMLMYAYIAGLMVLAILIVFVLPKLRFSPALW
ncbi:hypothetical protein BGZ57DRAFT_909276 [Hyaloscypha finlandica]|nr:hypothetical protein BGZ57DRAFT_909276 [Hyaloscypha finlandica]